MHRTLVLILAFVVFQWGYADTATPVATPSPETHKEKVLPLPADVTPEHPGHLKGKVPTDIDGKASSGAPQKKAKKP